MNPLKRMAIMAREEIELDDVSWWWLSFADRHGFKGGLLVFAHGFANAVLLANTSGLSPGGEIQAVELPPPTTARGLEANLKYSNRLLTKDECEAWEGEAISEGEAN